MVMRTALIVTGIALFALGCEPKAREEIVRDGGKAYEHASRAVVTAWNSVAAKVKEISPDSSDDAIAQARMAVLDLQKKAEAIPNPTPDVMAQLNEARASLAKIDAAEELKRLQNQTKALGEGAGEQYKKLQHQVDEARKRYDESVGTLEKLRPSSSKGR